MNHGSLFNGIGGFQLAAAWMGWQNIFSCEIDDFCNKVTKKHFPDCIQHGDIKTTDFTIYRGRIDIVTGGFPCQPYSQAGKRKGKEDERHLWPEMLRAIREIQPGYVVGENVRGITNWNGGLVFDEVQSDLETSGYEVLPFLLPACAVNAPHRRDRIWFIAHANSERSGQERPQLSSGGKRNHADDIRQVCDNVIEGVNSDTNSHQRCEGWLYQDGQEETEGHAGARHARIDGSNSWNDFPTQSPICGRNDGISDRVDRIKALGNAIVPQIAYEIFKAIEQTNL